MLQIICFVELRGYRVYYSTEQKNNVFLRVLLKSLNDSTEQIIFCKPKGGCLQKIDLRS